MGFRGREEQPKPVEPEVWGNKILRGMQSGNGITLNELHTLIQKAGLPNHQTTLGQWLARCFIRGESNSKNVCGITVIETSYHLTDEGRKFFSNPRDYRAPKSPLAGLKVPPSHEHASPSSQPSRHP